MKRKFIGIAAASLLAISAFGTTAASAATEFGDNCVADGAESSNSITIFALTAPGNPLPLTAPSGGVITKWKSNLIPEPISVPQVLKVLRQTGPTTVQIVGEASANIAGGSNTFDTRIPVQAGDRLGLFGPSEIGTLYCGLPGTETRIGLIEGSGGGVGSSATFVDGNAEARVPAAAIIEPDADNDGFGDETQDKCPESAAAQAPCPIVALGSSAVAKKGLATVLVTSNLQAPVSVSGTVKLGKGKTAKLSGGTQIVTPGTIAKFTLLFPQGVKAKLKELLRKQFLTLNVSVTAPNVFGPPSASNLKAKLRGQKKPPRKGKAKGQKPKGKG
jgi:hypothetical protein